MNVAKIIMIQGTASGVGKSILTTALCRIFKEDGYSVAPFKAQNMSSNYHTLENGDKMARSQAIAAYACGCEPHPDMNPILLMPSPAGGTEVVLSGKEIGAMNRFVYSDYKKRAFEEALAAFERLSAKYDVIVIEGAGSPVEMNLNKNDIVNMGFAEAVGAPVILVADINRGGVFASLYGTVMLFTESQRKLLKGLVVNKFRGDLQYFQDGKEIIEELCKKPVVGIVPYREVQLEDEDSLVDSGAEKTRASLGGTLSEETYRKLLDDEFDRLAAHFREHLDMKAVYEILDGGQAHG